MFQTEDATCPILNYEIISSSTSLPLPSSDDVYKVLGMSTRSSDEIKFNTGFTPANNIKKRTVEFKMNAYNYAPKKLQSGKGCNEYATKRISANTDKKYTLNECNAKCLSTTGCVQFEHSPTQSYRCDLYKAKDCTYNTDFKFNVYKPVPMTSKNTAVQSFKVNVYDCANESVTLVSNKVYEITEYTTAAKTVLKTSPEVHALFVSSDAANCPVQKIEFLKKDETAIDPASDP